MIPTSRAATPLVPDADQARQWLEDELSKPEYQAAQPTAFDLAMQAISDWFAELLAGATGVPGPVFTLIVVVVVGNERGRRPRGRDHVVAAPAVGGGANGSPTG